MFNIGWPELILTTVVILLVMGPKDMPVAMRALARIVRQARDVMNEVRGHVSNVVREVELEDRYRQSHETAAKPMASPPNPPPPEQPPQPDSNAPKSSGISGTSVDD